jgi:hypothetical protein
LKLPFAPAPRAKQAAELTKLETGFRCWRRRAVAALNAAGVSDDFTYISTAGGVLRMAEAGTRHCRATR